jgi:hypothetical protein
MKTLIYTMLVTNDKLLPWKEDIAESVTDDITHLTHAQRIIKRFNDYLQKGESLRRVIMVRPLHRLKPGMSLKHQWEKHFLVTQAGGFDVMKCRVCGAMGKRHGLQGFTVIDKKYAKYEHNCPNKRI